MYTDLYVMGWEEIFKCRFFLKGEMMFITKINK